MSAPKADLNGKNVLFIAYFYPPVESQGIPGAMRTIKFVRNLFNGRCHILTTTAQIPPSSSALPHLQPPISNETLHQVKPWDMFDALLKAQMKIKMLLRGCTKKNAANVQDYKDANTPTNFKSTGTNVKNESSSKSKAQQLKDFIYDLCYFPDQMSPWLLPAYIRGKHIVANDHIDVIFATGSPWTSLIIGYLISKATGKPLIADFRDPWNNNPFHQSKGRWLDKLAKRLEKKVVEHASSVSLNTEPLLDEFLRRYPTQPKDHFFVMPNGFDSADFNDLLNINVETNKNLLTLCHAGFLYGVRDPAVLLDAIKVANKKVKERGLKIRFHQIGDIELAYNLHERYASMISDGSLILDPPKPYQDCLSVLKKADWVVNVQPATHSQVPSKLYDYLAIKLPILNITPEDGALGRIVKKHNLGELFGFDDKDALAEKLEKIALKKRNSEPFKGYPNRNIFDSNIITHDLAKRIKNICS